MNAKTVDQLNIGLVFLSLLLAFQIPFSLFIYAYAILGPLHYLTEINWLSGRQYFVKEKWWLALVLGLSAVLVIPKFFVEPDFQVLYELEAIRPIFSFLVEWSNAIIFFLLVLSLILLSTSHRTYRGILIAVALLLAYFFNQAPLYGIVIGLLIPTIVHVYLFTLFFMVFGAMKSRSRWGFVAAGLVLLVPFAIILIDVDPQAYLFPEYIKRTFIENEFYQTTVLFSKFLGLTEQTDYQFQEFFATKLMVRMQIFIAFAYIYHYLNWFSKTTVIGWHKQLTTRRTLLIAGIWLFMTGVFLWNYQLGFYLALFFSFLHVFLEFPLNWLSIKGVLAGLVPAKT